MKKLILFLTIATFSLFIVGCSNTTSYDIKELTEEKLEFIINKVPFRSYAASREDVSEEMLKQGWKDQCDKYTTKGKKIYFYHFKIKGADIETFIPLSDGYSLDKNQVYIGHRILDIELEDFNFVSGALDYLSDGKDIYWGETKMQGVDIASFAGMGFENPINFMGYAKDKNNYYFRGEILTGEELKVYLDKVNISLSEL